MMRRRGFTLWEMTIVLALVAISAAIVIPAWSDLGMAQSVQPGEAVVSLLRDARKTAIENAQTISVRIDPTSGFYQVDSAGANGTGRLAEGQLALSAYESLITDVARLRFVFRPTGAAMGDTVQIRGEQTVMIGVDSWSGHALVYAR
jgi:prepilin-type N-terminal cleavage/methylation domain-containing protein